MPNKSQLAVGMTVYLKPEGNAARGSTEIKERIVKSVGRAYFYTWDGKSDHSVIKFRFADFRHENNRYSSNWTCYLSLQEIEDERESHQLAHSIRVRFGGYGNMRLSLDQLRRIKSVIDEDTHHSEEG